MDELEQKTADERLAKEQRLLKEERKKHQALQNIKEADRLARERRLLEEERNKLEALRLAEEDRQRQQQAQPQKQVALLKSGTGIMLGGEGYVLTSYHLLRGMKQIHVKFVNGENIEASLFIKDEANDIAFLKLSQSPNISLMNIAMLVKHMIPMLPETLAAPTVIVVVPKDTDSLQSFIKRVQNNIVLIEAKE